MQKHAEFSACRTYRYALWRLWTPNVPYAMFIGLNPSTADEHTDDPTSRRCIRFAQRWNYGGLCMVNLFAYRATYRRDLMASKAPIGPDNDRWVLELAKDAGIIIAAWGNSGTYLNRSQAMVNLIPKLHYLALNKSGEPAHPLYLKSDTPYSLWT